MNHIFSYTRKLGEKKAKGARIILHIGLITACILLFSALILFIISYPIDLYNYEIILLSKDFVGIAVAVAIESIIGAQIFQYVANK